MATMAQVIANQANAQKSTGPTTPEGKAAYSANSTKHGLSSAFRVLAHEDQDEFDQLLANAREQHEPSDDHQSFLVEQVVQSQWLLARAQRLMTGAFDSLAGAERDPEDPDSAIVSKMLETNPNAIATLERYAAHAEKSYHKCWRELDKAKQTQTEQEVAQRVQEDRGERRTSLIMRYLNPPIPGTSEYDAHVSKLTADVRKEAARDASMGWAPRG